MIALAALAIAIFTLIHHHSYKITNTSHVSENIIENKHITNNTIKPIKLNTVPVKITTTGTTDIKIADQGKTHYIDAPSSALLFPIPVNAGEKYIIKNVRGVSNLIEIKLPVSSTVSIHHNNILTHRNYTGASIIYVRGKYCNIEVESMPGGGYMVTGENVT